MFATFNMGVGFCLVVSPRDADRVVEILRANDERAQVIGTVGEFGKREVLVPQKGLTLLPPDA
jgi:phosphoribosylformylglycinamidine cyclo-ligase